MSGAPASRRRIFILSSGAVRPLMAGNALRQWSFAEQLRDCCDVILAAPNADLPEPHGFVVVCHGNDHGFVRSLLQRADAVIVHGQVLRRFPEVAAWRGCLVVDLYNPFTLESLFANRARSLVARVARNHASLDVLRQQTARGDFFICGHERQRDFWLGMLSAANRLNPQNFDADPTFRRLIDVVPFSVPADGTAEPAPALKGVSPGIAATDRVLLWAGGIWDWLDPLTAIRAVGMVARRRDDVRLVLLGVSSPEPGIHMDRQAAAARALADELGLTGRVVFFVDWRPRLELAACLREADLGICAHPAGLEARYSIRTRLFDYIAARLPLVVSEGDVMGKRLAGAGVAWTVPPGDAAAMAEAIEAALAVPDLRQEVGPRFDALLNEFTAERVAAPLVAYCRDPWPAADRPDQAATVGKGIARVYEAVAGIAPAARLVDGVLARSRSRAVSS